MSQPDDVDGQPRAARWLGGVPMHPVLAALWPALALWAANVDEVLPAEVLPTLWQPTLGVLVVWLVAGLLLRSIRRGAFVASAAAVVVLNIGRFTFGPPGTKALVASAVAIGLAAIVAWRLPATATGPITILLNVMGLTMVVLAAPPIVSTWGPGPAGTPQAQAGEDAVGVAGRDIFYIIPDRYPRTETLTSRFDHDNSGFIRSLEERGFQVADASLANYPKTAHSLVGTWNLAPVDELIPEPPADGGDWGPLYGLLRDHRLGRIVTEAGYDYLHLGSWWSPTATATSADRVLRVDTDSEFTAVWRTQTLLPAFVGDDGEGDATDPGDLSLHERNRRYSAYQLDELDRLARQRSRTPRFVLAHVTLPHAPFVFEPDGSLVTEELAAARSTEVNFVNQLEFLNRRLDLLIDQLLSGPEESWPIIVIQSDEGPHPRERTSASYDWVTAADEVLEEKLRTFSAILLPGSDLTLPEDLTGIDTWRYVLDEAIGSELGPWPETPPIEVFPGEDHLYDLVDVRDRVDAADSG